MLKIVKWILIVIILFMLFVSVFYVVTHESLDFSKLYVCYFLLFFAAAAVLLLIVCVYDFVMGGG